MAPKALEREAVPLQHFYVRCRHFGATVDATTNIKAEQAKV